MASRKNIFNVCHHIIQFFNVTNLLSRKVQTSYVYHYIIFYVKFPSNKRLFCEVKVQ